MIATVVGTGVGNWLSTEKVTGLYGKERWWISAIVLLGVAIAGWIASLFIMRLARGRSGSGVSAGLCQTDVARSEDAGHDRALLR